MSTTHETAERTSPLRGIKLVVGVEDTPYFRWQVAILLESVRDELDVFVALCTEWGVPSAEFRHIEEVYGVRVVTAPNPGKCVDIDASEPGRRYAALNRIATLTAVAPHVREDELVFLADADVFLHGPLNPDVFPAGNALQYDTHVAKRPFYAYREQKKGVDLPKLLDALGFVEEFRPGGVCVFLEGRTVKDAEFRRDCTRFAQLLFLAGKLAGVRDNWTAEMACYALALHAHGIPYEVVDRREFTTVLLEEYPPGSFCHYYHNSRDGGGYGAFVGDTWSKHAYRRSDFLAVTGVAELEALARDAKSAHARSFFELARAAKERLGV